MANRFQTPNEQFEDSTGAPLAGAKLFFYITGTSTKTNTYADHTLSTPNTNPVVLDSAGRAGNVFLDPAVTYKVVFAPATDTDPPTSPYWAADPVVDPAANVLAAFTIYNGNPNGNVAGSQGSIGGAGASVVWDITDDLLFVCTTTGNAAAAVWTQVGAALTGALTASAVLTPATLGASQNNYSPTGLSTAFRVRVSASAAYNITGLAAGVDGRLLVLLNVGSFAITLTNADASSTAANRFSFGANVVLGPGAAIFLQYDATLARWAPVASFVNASSTAQAQTGTDTTTYMNPAAVLAAINANSSVDNQSFTTSGTWTKPARVLATSMTLIYGRGGGGGGGAQATGGGGGGGAYTERWILTSLLGATETVTVDPGGAVSTAAGNSSFGTWLVAGGGGGGANSASGGGGGGGGVGAAGSSGSGSTGGNGGGVTAGTSSAATFGVVGGGIGCAGGSTAAGVASSGATSSAYGGGGGGGGYGSGTAGVGGASAYGGGGGGGMGNSVAAAGGTSNYGGAGGAGNVAGTAPGGGGGRNAIGARGEMNAITFI